ncbi:uncharacterized protein ACLA_089790 [Aspergillus clavatus NRRL 1]|uniref:Uncharacterized protein n=1 Tax=Aspergillus clavatus (strain ATCC 1007 / CBS 513.65 / DSM 816 / NCTC 3887 / NRRL 1 / QM 1276 / 107) TaxID=344612 RepID=A1CEI8_ASPCL|nr:uncharacterized protein ACLA_089790 [Aspergillus clavatus NRRL 1]EAW11287.1 conserved hypothetical protein [Aspergillus clavatus NRRL 1]
MGRGDESSTTAKSTQEQFRTPDKPPLTSSSTTSKARKDISSAKRQSGTPISSGRTSKSWKRSLLSGEQPTLTQIDFVTPRSQNLESDDDDDDLDYIDDAPHDDTVNSCQVIELDDDLDGDTGYRPDSHSRARRSGGAMNRQNAEGKSSRMRRSLGQANSSEKRSRGRKSTDSVAINKKRTDKSRKDKTLTQMDYVRRYLKIEPDDEVKLEYTYMTPKVNKGQTMKGTSSRDLKSGSANVQKISSSIKKRKLQDDDEEEEDSRALLVLAQTQGKRLLKEEPKTPQKPRRSEVPSSQSPESPGVAFISSSQFRDATRSPLRLARTNTFTQSIKDEIPDSNETAESLKQISMVESTLPPPIVPESSLSFELGGDDEVPFDFKATQLKSATEASASALEIERELDKPPPSTERTVVYETDAETDYSDNEQSTVAGPRYEMVLAHDADQAVEDGDEGPENDSQTLPPPIMHSSSDDERSLLQTELNLSSDASICYQRRHPATQFPSEPIPTLSTQKLAELFPQESSLQQTLTETSRIKPSLLRRQTLVDPFLHTQTQSQTQDLVKDSTEIVLESSPVARPRDYASEADPVLPAHPAQGVVQVESSQPVDRLKQRADPIQDSGPKGLLSRSQLLTSSVMESVPVPGFWMGSQDSVGQPYSLPDT